MNWTNLFQNKLLSNIFHPFNQKRLDVATSKIISSKQFSSVITLTDLQSSCFKITTFSVAKLTILIRKQNVLSVNKEQATQATLFSPQLNTIFNISSTFIFTATHPWYLLKYQTYSIAKLSYYLLPLCPNRISKTPTLQGYLANNTKNIRAKPMLCFYDLHFYIFPLLIRFEPDFRNSQYDVCVYITFG